MQNAFQAKPALEILGVPERNRHGGSYRFRLLDRLDEGVGRQARLALQRRMPDGKYQPRLALRVIGTGTGEPRRTGAVMEEAEEGKDPRQERVVERATNRCQPTEAFDAIGRALNEKHSKLDNKTWREAGRILRHGFDHASPVSGVKRRHADKKRDRALTRIIHGEREFGMADMA